MAYQKDQWMTSFEGGSDSSRPSARTSRWRSETTSRSPCCSALHWRWRRRSQRPPAQSRPIILEKEIYALAALAGAAVQVLGELNGYSILIVPWFAAAVCLVLRLLAMRYSWSCRE